MKAAEMDVRLLARLIAFYGMRNVDALERLHFRQISDPEMRVLMLDVEAGVESYLRLLFKNGVIRPGPSSREPWSRVDLGDWDNVIGLGPTYDLRTGAPS